MTDKIKWAVRQDPESFEPGITLCEDLDEDCAGVRCKLTCWLHAPELGICPFLADDTTLTKC